MGGWLKNGTSNVATNTADVWIWHISVWADSERQSAYNSIWLKIHLRLLYVPKASLATIKWKLEQIDVS
jgi:hypothetical protein